VHSAGKILGISFGTYSNRDIAWMGSLSEKDSPYSVVQGKWLMQAGPKPT
jgi:hypothetical protein